MEQVQHPVQRAAASDYKELLRLTEEKEAAEAALAELLEKWEQAAAQLE